MTGNVPLRLCVRRNGEAGGGAGVTLEVPTQLSYIEHAIEVVARHCQSYGVPMQAVRFNLKVALSEALSNAMVYGNRMNPAKQVRVSVSVGEHHIAVRVRDEGDGFDPASIPDPTRTTNLEHPKGRGLFLIRQLTDDYSFNDQGNAICMIWHRA